MTRLEELRAEKKELLKYREFLCNLQNNDSLSENEIKEETTKDKPKVKKLGVRKNDQR